MVRERHLRAREQRSRRAVLERRFRALRVRQHERGLSLRELCVERRELCIERRIRRLGLGMLCGELRLDVALIVRRNHLRSTSH